MFVDSFGVGLVVDYVFMFLAKYAEMYVFNLDLWIVSNVVNMLCMCVGCASLKFY